MFGQGAQYTLPEWINDLSFEDTLKLLLYGFFGSAAPSGGGAITAEISAEATAAAPGYTEGQNAPLSQDLTGSLRVRLPLVASVKVAGIQEVDTWAIKSGNYSVAAGALSIAFKPLASFVGTVNGVAWVLADGNVSRVAQPGNTCPAFAVTVSAGTYLIAESRPV